MARVVVVNEGKLRLDTDALSKVMECDYNSWKAEVTEALASRLVANSSESKVSKEHALEDIALKKLVTIQFSASNLLRVLCKRFFGDPPEENNLAELRTWYDNIFQRFTAEILKDFLYSCLYDIAGPKSQADPVNPNSVWKDKFVLLLQASYRSGVCMYPNCRALQLKFVCTSCSALFCSQRHVDLATEKSYHKHKQTL